MNPPGAFLIPARGIRRLGAGIFNTLVIGFLVEVAELATGTYPDHHTRSMAERVCFLGLATGLWLLCLICRKSVGSTFCLLEVRARDGGSPSVLQMLVRSAPIYVLAPMGTVPWALLPPWLRLGLGGLYVAILVGVLMNGVVGFLTGASVLDRWSKTVLLQITLPDHAKPRLFGIRIV